jgi:hypothetical protein
MGRTTVGGLITRHARVLFCASENGSEFPFGYSHIFRVMLMVDTHYIGAPVRFALLLKWCPCRIGLFPSSGIVEAYIQ